REAGPLVSRPVASDRAMGDRSDISPQEPVRCAAAAPGYPPGGTAGGGCPKRSPEFTASVSVEDPWPGGIRPGAIRPPGRGTPGLPEPLGDAAPPLGMMADRPPPRFRRGTRR